MPVKAGGTGTILHFRKTKIREDLQEFESSVSSAGVEAMQVITGSRKAPHPEVNFVGEGKAVEIAEAVKATGAAVVACLIDALSPAQSETRSVCASAGLSIAPVLSFRYFCPTCANPRR